MLQLAAIGFVGHYLASTRARVEFCSEHGVSIQTYITEFERIHITELSKSRKLLADMKIQEDNYYEMLKPQINKILVPEMGAIATDKNISDVHSRYSGAELNDQSLVPGDNAHIGPTSFEAWLQSNPQK